MTCGRRPRLALVAVVLGMLMATPSAIALNAPLDGVVVDTTATTDTGVIADGPATDTTATPTTTDPATATVQPASLVAEPVTVATPTDPAPLPPAATVTTAPSPALVVEPTPDPVPTSVTPPAPQELVVVVQDAPAHVTVVDAGDLTPAAAESAPVAPSTAERFEPSAPAASPVITSSSTSAPKPARTSSVSAPLVIPIVQALGPGLFPHSVRPEHVVLLTGPGAAAAAPGARGERGRVPDASPARATQVAADLPFGFVAPPDGWSGQGAGILALLMGFMPLGQPDGKSSVSPQTQTALLLVGALLIVLPFFACPIRDRRRRGPRGFATLALRPG